MERPFRFGIPLVHDGPVDELREQARAAEALGYSTLQAFDQLALEPMTPVPALAFAAAVTTTIRLGAYVFDNGYRHPVLLAKEAAVLDQLSGGRLELGVGAGYSEDEYRGSGLAFPAAGERVARLEEAVALLKRLFTDTPATFSGAFYRVDGFTLPSRPVQRPWPPLMIAGAPAPADARRPGGGHRVTGGLRSRRAPRERKCGGDQTQARVGAGGGGRPIGEA